jgi:hypothetical protein
MQPGALCRAGCISMLRKKSSFYAKKSSSSSACDVQGFSIHILFISASSLFPQRNVDVTALTRAMNLTLPVHNVCVRRDMMPAECAFHEKCFKSIMPQLLNDHLSSKSQFRDVKFKCFRDFTGAASRMRFYTTEFTLLYKNDLVSHFPLHSFGA